ncbi:NPP1 family protein [Streptomyces prasinopilosus]|uniref:Necrosis inducing protein (NPP1) n=1 Tax=Streptomyces prasinopilosus TaxID=67344 RepID=A0A1G6YQH6_9ACTN|nr:NPP1 family protein [Streptomyces prasinopilosus]SDD92754.1 Necrosis inducing protein (NPP1) [Streptomyces prasinopilosus]
MSPIAFRTHRRRWLTGLAGAFAFVIAFPATAFAAPPPALPAGADVLDRTYQPAYDYDTDGCYPTPAIGPDGTVSPGLNPTGALNGNCRDAPDLDSTNGYSRSKCDSGWCAVVYALYFEKDQALPGVSLGGHRHDWEHVVVWVRNDTVQYVSTSRHGSFSIHARSAVRFDGTHPKIVYHKDGIGTHCFRLASAGDEPPENHQGTWQYPALVGWNGYPAGLRDKLVQHDFGSANFGLKDGSFASHLAAAKPSGIPFDPYA